MFFYKAIEADNVLAILVGKDDLSRILGYGGKILKILGTKTGKRIRVLEKGGNYRKFLEQLFIPFALFTINTIWLPDGTTETRVIVKQRGRKRLPIGIEALKEIAQKARGITLRVEFSRY
jgi:transcription antitermination factor NusA-like protein